VFEVLRAGYVRRIQWEARVHAIQLLAVLGEALSSLGDGGPVATSPGLGTYRGKYREVTAEQLMAEMGAKWA
jgi:hypothetical protein